MTPDDNTTLDPQQLAEDAAQPADNLQPLLQLPETNKKQRKPKAPKTPKAPKVPKAPKTGGSNGSAKKALLIIALIVILGGAGACAYFFVPWKSIFGKERVHKANTDEVEEETVRYKAVNPFTGDEVHNLTFTQAQLDEMPHVDWNVTFPNDAERQSLVLLPEKKLLVGYNQAKGSNVIYDNALNEYGNLNEWEEPVDEEYLEEIPEEIILPEEVVNTQRVTEIRIVEDEPVKEIKTREEVAEATPAPTTTASQAREQVVVEEKKPAPNDNQVYNTVEQMPSFPGGDAALYKYMLGHLRYPEMAAQNGIQGRVIVQFVVKKDGSIGDVKIVRGVDKDLDKEAMRMVKSFPKFIPGKNNGQPVNVWYNLPVVFKLQ